MENCQSKTGVVPDVWSRQVTIWPLAAVSVQERHRREALMRVIVRWRTGRNEVMLSR
jgi:hypothetical protein